MRIALRQFGIDYIAIIITRNFHCRSSRRVGRTWQLIVVVIIGCINIFRFIDIFLFVVVVIVVIIITTTTANSIDCRRQGCGQGTIVVSLIIDQDCAHS